ncbi:MAG: hypothetical protein VYE64_05035 [Planctomycetota bacterium]|nr:hypothetical protein [Planctomycetota bacterium]
MDKIWASPAQFNPLEMTGGALAEPAPHHPCRLAKRSSLGTAGRGWNNRVPTPVI